MTTQLSNKKVAFLLTDGFEQVEFTHPWNALKEAGATVHLVSLKKGQIQGFNHFDRADKFDVDTTVDAVTGRDYDALVIPGGVHNPDTLRANKRAIELVQEFHSLDKPIAAICHGPWVLIEADGIKGKHLTSWPSLKTDIINSGGLWEDSEVVLDPPLITSRNPDDLPAFTSALISAVEQAKVPTTA